MIYLNMVSGFLEGHQGGWLANTHNKGGGRGGRGRRNKGPQEGRGVAGRSAMYQSLSKVTYKNNPI